MTVASTDAEHIQIMHPLCTDICFKEMLENSINVKKKSRNFGLLFDLKVLAT